MEGVSDVPAVKEVLQRRFGLNESEHFRMHPHQGKGSLPTDALSRPEPRRKGLLDQLPSKLRGYARSLPFDAVVLVVIDADNEPPDQLMGRLQDMLKVLPKRPNVLFRLAVEETESWFIADMDALKCAFDGKVNTRVLTGIRPDAIVGAWERLAQALRIQPAHVSGATKFEWARLIAPHLNLENPKSPSLKRLIEGVAALDGMVLFSARQSDVRAAHTLDEQQ